MTLLVLDIDGLLVRREKRHVINYRPYLKEFISFVYDNYSVAYFSSMTSKNGIPIIESILSPEQINKTVFFWFREQTRPDPELGNYQTIKMISDIRKQYQYQRIIMVDDSFSKIRFNDKDDIIIASSYQGGKDQYLLELTELIRKKTLKTGE